MPALEHFWAVVPAGGAGTRLWPVSRSAVPKFLHDLTGDGRSLLQHTVDRLTPLVEDRLLVVTGADHREAVLAELPGVDPEAVVAEPAPRDSMAAIGLAAAMLERADPAGRDGLLRRRPRRRRPGGLRGRRGAGRSRSPARTGWSPWASPRPTPPPASATSTSASRCPATRGRTARSRSSRSRRPTSPSSTSTAARTAGTPACSWPGPGCCSTCWPRATRTSPQRLRTIAAEPERLDELWAELPRIAVDHAVAEPAAAAGRVAVVPVDPGWDDIGDFDALAGLLGADEGRLSVLGDESLVRAVGVDRAGRARLGPAGRRWSASTTSSSSTPPTRCWSPAGSTPSG